MAWEKTEIQLTPFNVIDTEMLLLSCDQEYDNPVCS